MPSPPFVKLEGARQMSEQAFKEHPLAVLVNRIAGRLADASMLVACFILLWLVGLTCVDVVGRYFFRAPVTGATELVQISMAGIIFFSLPAMFLRDEYHGPGGGPRRARRARARVSTRWGGRGGRARRARARP